MVLLTITALLFSCATVRLPEENIPDDNIRNWYEIFVYSFADSDGDRIGDLRGATEKLDYVRDMGFTGIWLMPINPSPSYHKYDVTDYYDIDPDDGTLEDIKAFLDRAHELGIKVILDLVVNHTSNEHPWFQDAKTGEDAKYRDYYNWSPTPKNGYNQIGGSYFESRFVSTMPDLNLDNPEVRKEIEDIMRFWLEMGVDGFRLDAVTSYYTNQLAANIEFLSWLGNTARSIKPDCYIVGEAWSDKSTISNYYQSDIDSFFYFPMAGPGGEIRKILDEERIRKGWMFGNLIEDMDRLPDDHIRASFLGNHDMDRIAYSIGIYDLKRLKAAYGMLSVMEGGIYVYYGDEIGMIGKGADPNKRIGMLWKDRASTTKCPPGTNMADYRLPSVEEQEKDRNSLLNYVRSAMEIRNAYPVIARGDTEVVKQDDDDICILRKTDGEDEIYIVLNLSRTAKEVEVPGSEIIAKLDADLKAGNGFRLKDGILEMDSWGIAFLR